MKRQENADQITGFPVPDPAVPGSVPVDVPASKGPGAGRPTTSHSSAVLDPAEPHSGALDSSGDPASLFNLGKAIGLEPSLGKVGHRPVAGDTPPTEVEVAGPETLVAMLRRGDGPDPEADALETAPDTAGPGTAGPGTAELLVAADRLMSWVVARQAELVAALHTEVQDEAAALAASRPGGTVGAGLGFTLTAEELVPLLNLSGRAAHRLLGQSLTLVEDLPKTLQCLGAGMLTPRQAQIILDEALTIPAEALPAFEDEVLKTGAHLMAPRLKAKCTRVREKLHPESAVTRRRAATADRRIEVTPDQDGMAWLSAYLPAERACGIENRVTFMARALQNPQETRTLTQLKADVFGDLLTHHCDPNAYGAAANKSGAAATTGTGASEVPAETADASEVPAESAGLVDLASVMGVQPVVFVTVPVLTLLGGDEPADLEGFGPIDPDTARNLAAHAKGFTRILTHPETGTVLSVGRDRYKVPKDLRKTVLVRDKTCRHPGCNRPGPVCDLDHTIPWHQGGNTSYDNLAAVCRKHHMLKSAGYWHYHQPEPGTLTATSLSGKTYTTLPQPPPF
ncbi:HNH endonuclease signature motif containing protein [Arthrobacter sp. 260]|uniref:HNH endonuclease signature motif containing protein n=1 Tax=Arthrobacter sp. 260 TaxID=2735314 RepID=UPI001491260D|nr:HNH endonuclease signature motif containing protein [Arthrobacter sp. 260]NOJ59561.1 DUF222 domain-containing protein [Arthrobacter sp. 260]